MLLGLLALTVWLACGARASLGEHSRICYGCIGCGRYSPGGGIKSKEPGDWRGSEPPTTDDAGRYLVLALPRRQYEVSTISRRAVFKTRSGAASTLWWRRSQRRSAVAGKHAQSEVNVTKRRPRLSAVTTQDISGLVGEQGVKDPPPEWTSYDLLLPLNRESLILLRRKTGGKTGISQFQPRRAISRSPASATAEYFLLNGVEYTARRGEQHDARGTERTGCLAGGCARV